MQPAVDWDLAARLAARAVRPGPPATRAERTEVVEALRAAAPLAAGHVGRITRLAEVAGGAWSRGASGDGDGDSPGGAADVRVVDRSSWARANVHSLRSLAERVGLPASPGVRGAAGAGQVAAVLGLLSGAVLGQFDPWMPGGRLLLVAPNVLTVERSMGVDPADFRLWVTLHEQTHALQFAAAPWLADHLAARVSALLTEEQQRGGRGRRSDRPAPPRRRPGTLLDLLEPHQRVVLDEVGAVMALLEGHADVTMDAVGRSVVPSVRRIRRRFEARRSGGGRSAGLPRVLRSVLGLDVKLAQYRDGAAFVRAVRRQVGIDGLNAVWGSADVLPTAAEIADPSAWVHRVHGSSARG